MNTIQTLIKIGQENVERARLVKAIGPGKWTSVRSAIAAIRASGSHAFDDDARRFFRSRTGKNIYAGRVFIESVQGPEMPRQWQLWVMLDNGSACRLDDAAGQLLSLESWALADKLARQLRARFFVPAANAVTIEQRGGFWAVVFNVPGRPALSLQKSSEAEAAELAALLSGGAVEQENWTTKQQKENAAFVLGLAEEKLQAMSEAEAEQLAEALRFYHNAAPIMPGLKDAPAGVRASAAAIHADLNEKQAAELAALLGL